MPHAKEPYYSRTKIFFFRSTNKKLKAFLSSAPMLIPRKPSPEVRDPPVESRAWRNVPNHVQGILEGNGYAGRSHKEHEGAQEARQDA